MTDTWIDGNQLAGPLGDLFAVDVTRAVGKCDGCGQVAVLAETHVYAQAPGLVARCAGCDGVVLRLVQGDGRSWLDLRGLSYLEFSD